jgi:hypothetical protein
VNRNGFEPKNRCQKNQGKCKFTGYLDKENRLKNLKRVKSAKLVFGKNFTAGRIP